MTDLWQHLGRFQEDLVVVCEPLRILVLLGWPAHEWSAYIDCSTNLLLTVSVVNSYAPTLDSVLVVLDNNVDLPTDGKPIKHTRASSQGSQFYCRKWDVPPDFRTSNPSPFADFLSGSSN